MTTCGRCHSHEIETIVCPQCNGTGRYGHDCGEDTCCCANPEENMFCGLCDGCGEINACPICDLEIL